MTVKKVEQKTFRGLYAAGNNRPGQYITERCVFSLCEEGLQLIEIAPGIDLERDILSQMEFKPIIRKPPKVMDERIFRLEPMGLMDHPLTIPVEE